MIILPVLLTFAFTGYTSSGASGPAIHEASYTASVVTNVGLNNDDNVYVLYSDVTYHFVLQSWSATSDSFFYFSLYGLDVRSRLYDADNVQDSSFDPDNDYEWQDNLTHVFSPMPTYVYSYDYDGVDTLLDLGELELQISLQYYSSTNFYYVNLYNGVTETDVYTYSRSFSNSYYLDRFHTAIKFDVDDIHNQIGTYLSNFYSVGYETAYNEGYSVGYSNGSRDGYNSGFTDGYNDGSSSSEVATSIFLGIINIALLPINMFLKMLNFEVFGINIGGFVSALLTVAIAVILIRIIFGGNKSGS